MKVGDWVMVHTQRAHIEQYDGQIGQVATYLERQDVVYVRLLRFHICFYVDELQLINKDKEILL